MKRVSGEKTYSVTMILFRKREPDEKKPPPPTENVDPVAKNLEEVRGTKAKLQKQKGVADLVQFYIGSFDVKLDYLDHLYLTGATAPDGEKAIAATVFAVPGLERR